MDFQANFFQLLGCEVGFDLDQAALSESYLKLQKSAHPDKFANASDRDKRLAVQWTAHINEAFDTLKHPLKRAIYLLRLSDVDIEHNPTLPGDFLMQQIELREQLEDIEAAEHSIDELDQFKAATESLLKNLQGNFNQQYPDDLGAAEQTIYKMQFIHKLLHEAVQLEEKLLDY